MSGKKSINHPAIRTAAIIIFTGLCALVTAVTIIPIPRTDGFFNFVDGLVFFTGFMFGPLTGAIAGGVGPAIADIALGYAFYSPFTLVAHGLQGFLAGMMAYALRKRKNIPFPAYVITGLAGTAAMVGVYFIGAWVTGGFAASVIQVPFNFLQSAVGIALSVPLVIIVQDAYPPIHDYRF